MTQHGEIHEIVCFILSLFFLHVLLLLEGLIKKISLLTRIFNDFLNKTNKRHKKVKSAELIHFSSICSTLMQCFWTFDIRLRTLSTS